MIEYINSQGKRFNLQNTFVKVREANFHKYEFQGNEKKQRFGGKLLNFTKASERIPIDLLFYGNLEKRQAMMTEFHDIVSFDRTTMNPGKLVFNDWYAKGYFVGEELKPSNLEEGTANTVSFYCPDSFWIREEKYEFLKEEASSMAQSSPKTELDFPFDFPFDFVGKVRGVERINNKHYGDVDFELVIYGPVENPKITIGDNIYSVKTAILEGERLTINSNNRTVVKTQNRGREVNEFNKRSLQHDVFAKIPAGDYALTWNGLFGFDLTLFYKRSVPAWD